MPGPGVKRKAVASRSASLQTPTSPSISSPASTIPPSEPLVQSPKAAEWSPFDADLVASSIYSASATPLPPKPLQRTATVPPKLPPDNALRAVNRARLDRPMSSYDMTAKLGWGRKITRMMDTAFAIPPSQTTAQVPSHYLIF
jgi:hypothetical protein